MPENNNTICLLGSPRRGGNSDTLAGYFCDSAERLGADIETFVLSDLSYSGCNNLFRCKTDLTHCGLDDDLAPILEKIVDADVLVLASPVYFTSVTGQMKLVIDRFFSFLVPDYTTNPEKSRLGNGRTLVFVQTQGESEDKYSDLLDSFSRGFRYLGFDGQFLVRAWSVREPGDVESAPAFRHQCEDIAKLVFGEKDK